MRVLFVGLGSIAKRHIKNIKGILGDNISISVFRSSSLRVVSDDVRDVIDEVITSFKELRESYDAIFITNPTSMHFDTLQKFLELSNCFFIEKPVFVTGEEDTSCFQRAERKYYVAAPLRYCNVIQWLRNNMDLSSVYSIRVISSSYLPEWRPGVDYRNVYSAHKDMGGGVSIDLIHEWDYISYLIGFPQSIRSIISRKSDLEIDSDDIAVYIAEYSDKIVEVHLDYFGRKTQRRIELYTAEDTMVVDLIEQRITWLCSGKVLDLSEDRNSYQIKELLHFLDIVSGKIESDNTIEEACKVLRIARGVE